MSAARFKQVADAARIDRAVAALNQHGFAAKVVANGAAAKDAVLALIPAGSEVFTFTSATLDATGLTEALNAAPYKSLRDKMYALDRNTQSAEMRAIGSAPAFAVGSVHAITETGELMMASATGSQLPAYAYGAGHVVFVAEDTIQIDSSITYIYLSMLLSCWWVIVSSLGIVSLGEFN